MRRATISVITTAMISVALIAAPGPEAEITLSHLKIAAEERSIKGSYMGSCVAKRDIPRYLNMFQNGSLPVDKLMSRLIGFDDLNAAMDRLADAKTVREVLIP